MPTSARLMPHRANTRHLLIARRAPASSIPGVAARAAVSHPAHCRAAAVQEDSWAAAFPFGLGSACQTSPSKEGQQCIVNALCDLPGCCCIFWRPLE
jgi:hypothetical protein